MSHLMPTLSGAVSRIFLFLKAVRYGRHEEILPEFLLTVKNLSFAPGGPNFTPAAYRVTSQLPCRRSILASQERSVRAGWRAGPEGARLHGLCLAYFFQREDLSSSEVEACILPHVSQARSNHCARDPWVEPTPRLVCCPSYRPDPWRRICHCGCTEEVHVD
jgi:hypothetical protein